MNIHNANALRNSFILEEDEEELEEERQNVLPTPLEEESLDKSLELPFPELVFINLADNQVGTINTDGIFFKININFVLKSIKISEEDDLIPLASWPMLNEIIIYGNPIVYNNVGYPPLLKQYLIDRLGINVQKLVELKID